MKLETYTKQPHEIKDYDIDYAPWLAPMSDTINDVQVFVVCETDPQDSTLLCTQVSATADRCKFWMSGGTDGNQYKLTAQVTTVGGRLDESELMFVIKDY